MLDIQTHLTQVSLLCHIQGFSMQSRFNEAYPNPRVDLGWTVVYVSLTTSSGLNRRERGMDRNLTTALNCRIAWVTKAIELHRKTCRERERERERGRGRERERERERERGREGGRGRDKERERVKEREKKRERAIVPVGPCSWRSPWCVSSWPPGSRRSSLWWWPRRRAPRPGTAVAHGPGQ